MKKGLLSLAVAATLSVTALSAAAEDMYRGAWYAVPGVSYMNTDSDLEADDDVGGFIAIGKELSQHWDIQARLGHTSADEDLDVAGASGDYDSTTLGIDALYMFSRDKFRPFLLAGLGVGKNDIDYKTPAGNVNDDRTSWMANLGLGMQYLFSDRFGVQADLRHQWSKADGELAGVVDADETVGNTLLSLGGLLRFGAPAPMVAEAAPEPAPMPVAEPMPEPEPMPAPEPAPVKCMPQVETITLAAEKLFGFDKALLADTSEIDSQVIAKMKDNDVFTAVRIVGHTDRLGSHAYNEKLSLKRANMVRDYIISQGVDGNRLVAVGMGETQPKVECAGVRGRKALIECLSPNRRVEIEATRSTGGNCK